MSEENINDAVEAATHRVEELWQHYHKLDSERKDLESKVDQLKIQEGITEKSSWFSRKKPIQSDELRSAIAELNAKKIEIATSEYERGLADNHYVATVRQTIDVPNNFDQATEKLAELKKSLEPKQPSFKAPEVQAPLPPTMDVEAGGIQPDDRSESPDSVLHRNAPGQEDHEEVGVSSEVSLDSISLDGLDLEGLSLDDNEYSTEEVDLDALEGEVDLDSIENDVELNDSSFVDSLEAERAAAKGSQGMKI